MINVVCVWTGDKYSIEYVLKLQKAVSVYLKKPHQFICLTDNDVEESKDVLFIDISSYYLSGWWAKMLVFDSDTIPNDSSILYLDLDTIIKADISALTETGSKFAICANFTRALQSRTGEPTWPCLYGSCIMWIDQSFDRDVVFAQFFAFKHFYMGEAGNKGDQWVIQKLIPIVDVSLFQDILPDKYIVHYKDFTDCEDDFKDTSILIFAGKTKPDNCKYQWTRKYW